MIPFYKEPSSCPQLAHQMLMSRTTPSIKTRLLLYELQTARRGGKEAEEIQRAKNQGTTMQTFTHKTHPSDSIGIILRRNTFQN